MYLVYKKKNEYFLRMYGNRIIHYKWNAYECDIKKKNVYFTL